MFEVWINGACRAYFASKAKAETFAARRWRDWDTWSVFVFDGVEVVWSARV